jgi:hypothetical protein
MRKSIIRLAAAFIFTAASSAVIATAQVTGIRHSDGSWTFVDANGRDIHKNHDVGRAARGNGGMRRGLAHAGSDPSRHDREDHEDHKVTGYLPWLSR